MLDGMPNPGSDKALADGCICPVMDNNHGKYPPYPPDGWWMVEGCPVHTTVPAGGAAAEPEAPDMVVIPRRWEKPNQPGRRKQLGHGWTLHLATCQYVRRATQARPAPAEPYPHTEPCIYCKPTGDTGKRITRSPAGQPKAKAKAKAKTNRAASERHLYHYVEITDDQGQVDEVEARCATCGITARAKSRMAARVRAYRKHEAARQGMARVDAFLEAPSTGVRRQQPGAGHG